MKGILQRPGLRNASAVIAYLATLVCVRPIIVYRTGAGGYDDLVAEATVSLIALLSALASACIFALSVHARPSPPELKEPFRALRKLDYSMVVSLAAYTLLVCLSFARSAAWHDGGLPLFLTAPAYGSAMVAIGETAARKRDGTIKGSLHWLSYFKLYPVRHPAGLAMACLLAATTACMLIVMPAWAVTPNNDYSQLAYMEQALGRSVMAALMAFSLAALSYLSSFVSSLASEFELANQDKIRSERFKAELITNVSHDLRTPLTSIVSYIDLISTLPIEHDGLQGYIKVLGAKADRLRTLTDDLLEASKAATGNLPVDKAEIDLSEIAGQVAGEFDDQFAGRGLTVVFDPPGLPVCVNVDSRHLWRVLENLFGNAVKYALPGTRVFVDVGADATQARLTLRNTSEQPIDLPPDALTGQFIRGDRSRHGDGSGLGLYIAKCLVELMDGEFNVRAIGDLFEVEMVFGREEGSAP
jgi:signal transduction histidine kinase